jgi:hypothetical protein
MLAGCYGRFQTTRAVYKWNADVSEDKLVRSVVMWGLLPIYSIGSVADLLVLNPLDFWHDTKIEVGSGPDPKGTTLAVDPNENARGAVFALVQKGQAMAEVR